LILRVGGYKYKGEDVMSLENWKDLIPLPHKLEAVRGFTSVWQPDVQTEDSLITVDSLDLAEDTQEISLVVLQNGEEHQLMFKFTAPESEDFVRYNRATSKMQFVKTKQRNVQAIRVPLDITPYIKLFDKLCVSVEGYVYNGEDLMKQSNWKDLVDAYHKRIAVSTLFTVSLEETEGKATGGSR